MKKYVLVGLMMAMLLPLAGCRGKMDRLREQIRFEGIEAVRVDQLPRVEIDFRAANGSAYNLSVEEAEVQLRYRSAVVASLLLEQGVTLPRRTEGVISSHWTVQVRNPLAMIPVVAKVAKGDVEQLTVDLRVAGHAGVLPVNILREKMPLSDFLNTFDVDPDLLNQIVKR